jgi:SAM-dependent methyltransferase
VPIGRAVTREHDRVRAAYRRRQTDVPSGKYAPLSPTTQLQLWSRHRALTSLLGSRGSSLAGNRVLEVGCGGGGELIRMLTYGAKPTDVFGVDLLRERLPPPGTPGRMLQLTVADAAALPFRDRTFDIVSQFTMFSSILDETLRRHAAAEFLRVLRPSGIIIWYDFFLNNPCNSDVKAVRLSEITSLFPGASVAARRVTLIPPLARAVASRSLLAASLFEALPLLRSHYLAILSPCENAQ